MKVEYIGERDSRIFERNKAYSVMSVERGWYRIYIEEEEDDYLFPHESFRLVEGSIDDGPVYSFGSCAEGENVRETPVKTSEDSPLRPGDIVIARKVETQEPGKGEFESEKARLIMREIQWDGAYGPIIEQNRLFEIVEC